MERKLTITLIATMAIMLASTTSYAVSLPDFFNEPCDSGSGNNQDICRGVNDINNELVSQTSRIDSLNSTQISELTEQNSIQIDITELQNPSFILHQQNFTIINNTGFNDIGLACDSGEVIISGGVELLFEAIGIQGFYISPQPITNSFNATVGSGSVDITYRLSAYCQVLP